MKLKDAYMQAFKEELEPLVAAGKIQLLGTIEEVVEGLILSFEQAAKKGAKLSEDKWDDMVVPPAVDFLVSRLGEYANKIDGQEG